MWVTTYSYTPSITAVCPELPKSLRTFFYPVSEVMELTARIAALAEFAQILQPNGEENLGIAFT